MRRAAARRPRASTSPRPGPGSRRGRCDRSTSPAKPAVAIARAPTRAPTAATRPTSAATSLTARAVQHRHHRSIPLLDDRQRHQRQSRPPRPRPGNEDSRSRPAVKHHLRLTCQASPETGQRMSATRREDFLYAVQGRLASLAAGAGCGRPQAAVLAAPLGRAAALDAVGTRSRAPVARRQHRRHSCRPMLVRSVDDRRCAPRRLHGPAAAPRPLRPGWQYGAVDDVVTVARGLLAGHPAVKTVEFAGSRSRGTHDELSDWDFAVETSDFDALAPDMPALVAPLDPSGSSGSRWVTSPFTRSSCAARPRSSTSSWTIPGPRAAAGAR